MKVLNAYAGLGGNRKEWGNVQVTAVEKDPEIARAYQAFFPDDIVVVGDAHEFILHRHNEFDLTWSSRPCVTHSRARFWRYGNTNPVYPDLGLYEEILFLQHHCKGKWVVENVVPYYKPLIPGKQIGRHMFWSNFPIGDFEPPELVPEFNKAGYKQWSEALGFNLDGYNIERKDRKLRNCVHPETGRYILNCARNIITKSNTEQTGLFEEVK